MWKTYMFKTLCKDHLNITHNGHDTANITTAGNTNNSFTYVTPCVCVCDKVIWGRSMFSLSMMPITYVDGTPAHFNITGFYIRHVAYTTEVLHCDKSRLVLMLLSEEARHWQWERWQGWVGVCPWTTTAASPWPETHISGFYDFW